jgi:hypothetical protein
MKDFAERVVAYLDAQEIDVGYGPGKHPMQHSPDQVRKAILEIWNQDQRNTATVVERKG